MKLNKKFNIVIIIFLISLYHLRIQNGLEKKCSDKNIEFVSIIRELINPNGLTKMEYFKDYCHLNHKKCFPMVVDKFKNKGLICG